LVDTSAFWWEVYGNSAEWAFSTQNGQVISQLVYTRYVPGSIATISSNAGARPRELRYSGRLDPGVLSRRARHYRGRTDEHGAAIPDPMQQLDPSALTLYERVDSTKKALYWEDTTTGRRHGSRI
jgi:hypothetical protein